MGIETGFIFIFTSNIYSIHCILCQVLTGKIEVSVTEVTRFRGVILKVREVTVSRW